jgi:hypothetical protein
MARGSLAENSPWRRKALTIPPASPREWFHLAVWELWMGVLICCFLSLGAALVTSAPDRVITSEFLNAAFSALFGTLALIASAWLVQELWTATAPEPITDDFLRMLNNSFARNWRDPRTWPWSRLFYSYAFALLGIAISVGAVVGASTALAQITPLSVIRSQEFRVTP